MKLYGSWVGLDPVVITCHTLHHTAVMRLIWMGADDAGALQRLGAHYRRNTVGELKKVERIPLLVRNIPNSKFQAPPRRPRRFKLRNHKALKHGLWVRYLPKMEWLD
jgi:hypothetical protein